MKLKDGERDVYRSDALLEPRNAEHSSGRICLVSFLGVSKEGTAFRARLNKVWRGSHVQLHRYLNVPLLLLVGMQSGNLASYAHADNLKTAFSAASTEESRKLFVGYCTQCHAHLPRAPRPDVLRQMSAQRIYETLTNGAMRTQGAMLSEQQKRNLSEWVSGQKLSDSSDGDAREMPNHCSENITPPDDEEMTWASWGLDLSNTRFQPSSGAGLTRKSVPDLKLRWVFALPGAASVYGQPAVFGRTLFVTGDSGYVYALDVETGCVHWSYRASAGVRTGPTVAPWPGSPKHYGVYFGDIQGNVYGLDAFSGEMRWKVVADPHPLARISGAVKFYRDRLYVPVTSFEEARTIADPNYACCTFRGSLVSLDAATGRQIWKTYTLSEVPRRRTLPSGNIYFGPAGAGVWNSPAIDTILNAVYFGSGNSYTGPATSTSDAVFALDLITGRLLWSQQLLARDIWLWPSGPDQDIAAAVIVRTLIDGRRVVVVAQKSLGVWAFDPDHDGALLWHQSDFDPTTQPGTGGDVVFGGTADTETVYFALTAGALPHQEGGLVALDIATGKPRWYRAVRAQRTLRDHPGISAALSMIPGVVFSGGLDGALRAFSTLDGSEIWSFNTARKFATVNGADGRGGSIGSAGPVIVHGWIFVTSGYVGFQNGVPGNLLLAFSP